MSNTTQHWDNIYQNKANHELGWYEHDVSQTFKFLSLCKLTNSSSIFLPGAGTSLLVDKLNSTGYQLILNDLSQEALNLLAQRVGTSNKQFIVQDIAKPLTPNLQVDLWLDRAVLHFLLTEEEINGYFANVKQVVNSGGYVLLAEFSTAGAKKCAGLELHQYSLEEMQTRLGEEFSLVAHEAYTFINPFGDSKPYIYALFQHSAR